MSHWGGSGIDGSLVARLRAFPAAYIPVNLARVRQSPASRWRALFSLFELSFFHCLSDEILGRIFGLLSTVHTENPCPAVALFCSCVVRFARSIAVTIPPPPSPQRRQVGAGGAGGPHWELISIHLNSFLFSSHPISLFCGGGFSFYPSLFARFGFGFGLVRPLFVSTLFFGGLEQN